MIYEHKIDDMRRQAEQAQFPEDHELVRQEDRRGHGEGGGEAADRALGSASTAIRTSPAGSQWGRSVPLHVRYATSRHAHLYRHRVPDPI